MNDKNGHDTAGLLCLFLLIAFIILKLTHAIIWSWWWVLAPAWGPIAICILILAAVFAVEGIKVVIHRKNRRKR